MTATPKILDITQGVSEEQYVGVLTKLLDQFENWRLEQRWCTDIYLTVSPLTHSYLWDPYASGFYTGYDGRMQVIPVFHTDESRAEDLRNVRGRILWYAMNRTDVFSVAKANEFLSAAGLPAWEPKEEQENSFYVSFGISGNITTKLTEDELKDKFYRWAERNGYARNMRNFYAEQTSPRSRVPEEEQVHPIRGVGRPTARP